MLQRSHMAAEIREAPDAVARQERELAVPLKELAGRMARLSPRLAMTCARGSSGHAAVFAKHCIERYLGIAVADAAPSIATVYRRALKLDGQLYLAISQSGHSDDLIEQTLCAKAAGALTAALVNDTDSPLARACDIVLPMAAGPERSIAATKSFIASLAAILRLVAACTASAPMRAAIARLPERLAAASTLDWSRCCRALQEARVAVAIGRGPTLAIALEAALKLKETAHLHAEGFSGAEFLHGPVTLVEPGYPILMFMPSDAAAGALQMLAAELRTRGAELLIAGQEGNLPELAPDHPEADAICLAQSFYAMAEALAVSRGLDADRPPHLSKVTRTR